MSLYSFPFQWLHESNEIKRDRERKKKKRRRFTTSQASRASSYFCGFTSIFFLIACRRPFPLHLYFVFSLGVCVCASVSLIQPEFRKFRRN